MPTLRQFDLIAIWLAVLGLAAVSWIYLIDMAKMMEGMSSMASGMNSPMEAMSNVPNAIQQSEQSDWQPKDFWRMFVMWAVMMIAMMVPTATRTLMIFAQITHQQVNSFISPTYFFLLGYILVWTVFSAVATLFQWQLDEAALLSPMMVSTSYTLGAILLIAAGIYQLTPFKDACLRHCQSPIGYISEHFKPGLSGAFSMGIKHGGYCLGCCWLLMSLLFVAGVMNLLWILLITFFVLLEKNISVKAFQWKVSIQKLTGVLLIISGLFFVLLDTLS